MGRKLTLSQLWYRDEYLQSKWWEHVKIEVKKRDGYACSMKGCLRKQKLEYHHLSYEDRGGDSEIDDIRIVCKLHHYLCHKEWFGIRELKLEKNQLTRRYKKLRRAWWRRAKPSSLLKRVYIIYSTN